MDNGRFETEDKQFYDECNPTLGHSVPDPEAKDVEVVGAS
jgi:hypothetical protein